MNIPILIYQLFLKKKGFSISLNNQKMSQNHGKTQSVSLHIKYLVHICTCDVISIQSQLKFFRFSVYTQYLINRMHIIIIIFKILHSYCVLMHFTTCNLYSTWHTVALAHFYSLYLNHSRPTNWNTDYLGF